ncbi:hypothetical protein [Streptomyces lincolnensis]|uniref:hypothetical protein n=1 Tax=Streptomyces lincolnensis TaxID=1915 RepID=UPI0037D8A73E
MTRPAVGWRTWGTRGAVLGFGALWWWAVLRLALSSDAGVLEGAVAAGGWGLSLLPVHCVPKARAVGAVEAGRWRAAWRGTPSLPGPAAAVPDRGARGASGGVTRAWSRRRWGGGSGPS